MYEIDKIDANIVSLLLEDGRMPASEIARRLGDVSERAVRYRINRMIEDGAMRVSAIASPQVFGLSTRADVLLEVEADKILEVANKLVEYPNVTYVACAIGETDVSVQLVAKDTVDVYRFVTEVISKVPGVRKTNTSIVPIVLKDVYQWRIPVEAVKGLHQK